jgi:hypothetical protein
MTDISGVLTASIIRAMMEAVSTSEMSVSLYETAQCSTQEDEHLQFLMQFMTAEIKEENLGEMCCT